MAVRMVIPARAMRSAAQWLSAAGGMVAVGTFGRHTSATGDIELLVPRLDARRATAVPARGGSRAEVGFAHMRLDRPDCWSSLAWDTRRFGQPLDGPQASLLLGTGRDLGLITGLYIERGRILPIHELRVVGAGMSAFRAVDFLHLHTQNPSIDADHDRWSRLIGALGGENVWRRFTSLSFGLIGAGRTGSLAAATLIRMGVGELALIDPDVIESHNLDAMDGPTMADIGRSKAAAVARHLGSVAPRANIVALPVSVSRAAARAVLAGTDILISCVDDDGARLATACIAAWYMKPHLDVGTGIFLRTGERDLGADIRLLLPGDGCLLCAGGADGALSALRRSGARPGRGEWRDERAGSLRSLNAIAAHVGIRLIEDLVASRTDRSTWVRYETDPHGVPTIRSLPVIARTGCPLCAETGRGDDLGDDSE